MKFNNKSKNQTREKKADVLSKKMKREKMETISPKQGKMKSPVLNLNNQKQNKLQDDKNYKKSRVQKDKITSVKIGISKSPKSQIEVEDVNAFNVHINFVKNHQTCLKEPLGKLMNILDGRLSATGSLCFEFNDKSEGLSAMKTIENLKCSETNFKVSMSYFNNEPKKRVIYIGKDAKNISASEEAMKTNFKAASVISLKNIHGYTGLSILTFDSVESAQAADKVEFNYEGKVRTIRPWAPRNYISSSTEVKTDKKQVKELMNTKSLKIEKNRKGVNGAGKRKVEVLEENGSDEEDDMEEEEEEDDDDDDDDDDMEEGEEDDDDDDDDDEE